MFFLFFCRFAVVVVVVVVHPLGSFTGRFVAIVVRIPHVAVLAVFLLLSLLYTFLM